MLKHSDESNKIFRHALGIFVETVSKYALIADFFAFMAIITTWLSGFLPLWPSVAILLITWMIIVSLTIVGALVKAIIKAQGTINDLEERLDQTPDIRTWRMIELKEMFCDFTDKCKDIKKYYNFLDENVFPFLIKEFGFDRIGIVRIKGKNIELLSNSSKSKNNRIYNELDLVEAKLLCDTGKTSDVSCTSKENFVIYLLPVQGSGNKDRQWYLFSFYVFNEDQPDQTVRAFLDRGMRSLLQNAFNKVHNNALLEQLRKEIDLRRNVIINYSCAILRPISMQGEKLLKFNIDPLYGDVQHMNSIFFKHKDMIGKAFSSSNQVKGPIVTNCESYSVSFIPFLINDRVYQLVAFIDELDTANGLAFSKVQNHTHWNSLYKLTHHLHQGLAQDEVTSLLNKNFFNRHLSRVISDSNSSDLLGLFIIKLGGYSTRVLDKSDYKVLQGVAHVINHWVEQDLSYHSVAAAPEVGVFALIIRNSQDEEHARALALGIKEEIEQYLSRENTLVSVFIGVRLFYCDSECISDNTSVLRYGMEILSRAREEETGIYVTLENFDNAQERKSPQVERGTQVPEKQKLNPLISFFISIASFMFGLINRKR